MSAGGAALAGPLSLLLPDSAANEEARRPLTSGRPESPAAMPEDLVRQHWDSVYRLLYHLSRNLHDTEDLTQETFLRAIGKQARPGSNLRAWLLRIATNAFLDLCRRRKTAGWQPMPQEPAWEAGERQPAEELAGEELSGLVAAAVSELPESSRVVFLLRTQEDLSYRQIASALEVSEETARWHMLQARRALLKRLEGKL